LRDATEADLVGALHEAAERAEAANALLLGEPGLLALLSDPSLDPAIGEHVAAASAFASAIEQRLDRSAIAPTDDLEDLNAGLIRVKDALWAIERDRLRTARAVADLAGPAVTSRGALAVYLSVQQALSALDR